MNSQSDSQLMQIFDFTAEDLAANRDGRITDEQIQRLSKVSKQENKILIGLCIALIALMCLPIFLFKIGDGIQGIELSDYDLKLLLILIPILVLAMLGVVFEQYRSVMADIKSGKAYNAFGIVKQKRGRGQGYLIVDKIELILSEEENRKLKAYLEKISTKSSFHVYYSPRFKHVLSMELTTQ